MFLTIVIIFSVFGSFFGLMATSSMRTKSKLLKSLVGIIVSLTFGFFVGGMLYLEEERDTDLWNNGYCECGNEWEFKNADKHKMTTRYYYYCDECGEIIELTSPKK